MTKYCLQHIPNNIKSIPLLDIGWHSCYLLVSNKLLQVCDLKNDFLLYLTNLWASNLEILSVSALCWNVRGCSGIGVQLTDRLVWRASILPCHEPLPSLSIMAQLKFLFFQESFPAPTVKFNLPLLQNL